MICPFADVNITALHVATSLKCGRGVDLTVLTLKYTCVTYHCFSDLTWGRKRYRNERWLPMIALIPYQDDHIVCPPKCSKTTKTSSTRIKEKGET